MTKRLDYIDLLKAAGIWLIVFGHVPIENEMVSHWVHSFHVPLFFFVSGFLYKSKGAKFPEFLLSNIRCLVLVAIPYFFLNCLFEYIQLHLGSNIDFSFKDKIFHLLLVDNRIGPVWFFFSLFWMRIIYYLLYDKLHLKEEVILLLSLLLAIGLYLQPSRIPYYQIFSCLMCLPFYVIGAIFRKYELTERYKRPLLFLTPLFLIISVGSVFVIDEINVNGLKFSENVFYFYIVAISGVLLFLNLCLLTKTCPNFIRVISNGTIVVLGLHFVLIPIFKIIYKKAFHITTPPPYIDLVSGILITFLIFIILYPIVKYVLNSKYSAVRFFAGKK